jgi:hypothetical protein
MYLPNSTSNVYACTGAGQHVRTRQQQRRTRWRWRCRCCSSNESSSRLAMAASTSLCAGRVATRLATRGGRGSGRPMRGCPCRLQTSHRPGAASASTAAARPPPPPRRRRCRRPGSLSRRCRRGGRRASRGDLGAALVGWQGLYWWPDDGWQRSTVARLCPRCHSARSHMVAYLAAARTANSLLDSESASYGARSVPPGVAVRVRVPRPGNRRHGRDPARGPPTPTLTFSLVGDSSQST